MLHCFGDQVGLRRVRPGETRQKHVGLLQEEFGGIEFKELEGQHTSSETLRVSKKKKGTTVVGGTREANRGLERI